MKKARMISMTVIVEGGEISDAERKEYEKYVRERRITGYLVGTLDRFNDGKLAEVKDRVPHNYGVDYTHTVSGLLDD